MAIQTAVLPAPWPDILDARLHTLMTNVSRVGNEGSYADNPSKAYWRIHKTVVRLGHRMVDGASRDEVMALDGVVQVVIDTLQAELMRFASQVELGRMDARREDEE